jgi:hypothetical protein
MATKAVVDAINAVLGVTWRSLDMTVLPVVGLNGKVVSQGDAKPFVLVDYPIAFKKWLTLGDPGNNQFRETGGFRIVINETRGLGIGRAQGWADELASLFQGKEFLSGALQCDEAGVPVVSESNDRGNYFQFSFVVTYRYYSFG